MDADVFDPELEPAARWLPHGVGRRWVVALSRWLPALPARRGRPGVKLLVERVEGAPIDVRVLRPQAATAPTPAIVWIHGGGYVLGTAAQDDATCARLALATGATVVSVDYRLAPEHPFPTPLEDCFAAYEHVHCHASRLGVDPRRVAIAGQSAGAGLAAALTLLVQDRDRPRPVLQLLLYPMLDDRTVLRAVDGRSHRLWDAASNRLGWRGYLGQEPGGAGVPELAAPARRERLEGGPATWIGVGTCDLFHDEDVAFAQRLRAAGVPVMFEEVPGAFHAFDRVVPQAAVSRRFFDSQVGALRQAFMVA